MNAGMFDPILEGFYSDQRSCHLLRLPLELRLRIWEHVCPPGIYSGLLKREYGDEKRLHLVSTQYRDIVGFECGYYPAEYYEIQANRGHTDGHPSLLLSIAQTCRVLYQDVIPLLYGNHTFTFFYKQDMVAFFSIIPSSYLQFIRHVVLKLELKLDKKCATGSASTNTPRIRTRSSTARCQAMNGEWFAAVKQLLCLPKLKTLDVIVDDNHVRQPKSLGYTDTLRLDSTVELLRPFVGKRGQAEGRRVVLIGETSRPALTDYVALLDATLKDEGIPFEAIDPHTLGLPFPPAYLPSYMLDMIACYALPLPEEVDEDL